MASNPILIGYEWSQAFDFPPGFLQPSDVLRAEFRKHPTDDAPLFEVLSGSGISVENDRVFLRLSSAQTAAIPEPSASRERTVVTNFAIARSGRDIPIGVLITIPAVIMPTRAAL